MKQTMLVAVLAAVLGTGCMETFEYREDGDTGIDVPTDTAWGDTPSDTDVGDTPLPDGIADAPVDGTDVDADADAEPDPHADLDGDGFTVADGDCDDADPRVNPHAFDIPGNGTDEDCNGIADDPAMGCDCFPDANMAQALGLCDPRFLTSWSDYASTPAAAAGRGVVGHYGAATNGLAPTEACSYAILDTGLIEPISGGLCDPDRQPGTDFHGSSGCPGEPDPDPAGSDGTLICDVQQMRLELVAPSNATGFSFDLVFVSSEFPEWLGSMFLDTFYALLDRVGEERINVTVDAEGQALSASSTFMQSPPATDLSGTGYSDMITDGTGVTSPCGSSTGWLRTAWPIGAGEHFTLTFSIHDEGDGIYDSLVILDGFRWLFGPVEPGTVGI